jgi:uncharacterized protein
LSPDQVHRSGEPFVLPEFRPLWWLPGGHAQTIATAFWRDPAPATNSVQQFVSVSDGDQVAIHDDLPAGWQPGDRVALLMHGLSGNAQSPMMVRVAQKLKLAGVRSFRLDLRGVGAGATLSRKTYHAGSSNDLAACVAKIEEICRIDADKNKIVSPLALIGVSISANVLLKYLGEQGENVASHVKAAIAVNPPVDLARCVRNLESGFNRFYNQYFVKSLMVQLEHRRRNAPLADMPRTVFQSGGIRTFDSWYTAPFAGYSSAEEYYEHCSSAHLVEKIRVPTFLLTSANDPFVPVKMFHELSSRFPSCLEFVEVAGGGHVGYLGSNTSDPDRHWVEWRIMEILDHLLPAASAQALIHLPSMSSGRLQQQTGSLARAA